MDRVTRHEKNSSPESRAPRTRLVELVKLKGGESFWIGLYPLFRTQTNEVVGDRGKLPFLHVEERTVDPKRKRRKRGGRKQPRTLCFLVLKGEKQQPLS